MMAKKSGDVKKKEDENRAHKDRKKTWEKLAVFRLGKDGFCEAVSKEKTCARILGGKQGETLAGGGEVADTFEAQVASVGVFDQNVIAEFHLSGILAKHDHYSPAG